MKKTPEQVLAELTGDDRTVTEAATHDVIRREPCACRATTDHDPGDEA